MHTSVNSNLRLLPSPMREVTFDHGAEPSLEHDKWDT